jgi:hypothetical protein
VNGDERGPSLVGLLGCRAGTKDFRPALAALVGPVQNIFSSLYTISIQLYLLPSKLGRQQCWVGRLSLGMCLCFHMTTPSIIKDPIYLCLSYILSGYQVIRCRNLTSFYCSQMVSTHYN